MTLLVAIPCYAPSQAHDPAGALHLLVEKVRAAITAPVHVFYPPEGDCTVPPGVTLHVVPPLPEPESKLPPGWLTATKHLAETASGNDVLLLDYRNCNLSAQEIAHAATTMAQQSPDALLSVKLCRDHPCQWEEYFDIVASHVFTPVDMDAASIADRSAEILGAAVRPHVSRAFAMPAGSPLHLLNNGENLYEFVGADGLLRIESPGAWSLSEHLPLHQRVFLWRQIDGLVHQVSFSNKNLAALPLFLPARLAPACFTIQDQTCCISFASNLPLPLHYQVYPLPDVGRAWDIQGSLEFHVAEALKGKINLDTSDFAGVLRQNPLPHTSLFLFNALTPATPPEADIALPFRPANGRWEVDPLTLIRRNCATNTSILGRQDFPDILELEGTVLALSARVLNDPLESLTKGRQLLPLFLCAEKSRQTQGPSQFIQGGPFHSYDKNLPRPSI